MNSLEFNIEREQYNKNNTNQMKNLLHSASISLENFKYNLDPDLHPINNNLVSQGKRWLAMANYSSL